MKKTIMFAALLLGIACGVQAQDLIELNTNAGLEDIAGLAAKANFCQGFGKGYLMLGDTDAARTFRWVEIGGWSAFGIGMVGLAGTKVVYDFLVASVGKVTTADFYVFGGMAIVGLSTVITSRIISRNRVLNPSFGVCSIQSNQILTVGLSIRL